MLNRVNPKSKREQTNKSPSTTSLTIMRHFSHFFPLFFHSLLIFLSSLTLYHTQRAHIDTHLCRAALGSSGIPPSSCYGNSNLLLNIFPTIGHHSLQITGLLCIINVILNICNISSSNKRGITLC